MFLFSMSKLDIRNYLQGIYKVDVYKVNTRIQHGEQSWKLSHVRLSKTVLDSGFNAVDSLSVELGFAIPIVREILDSSSSIPDSKA